MNYTPLVRACNFNLDNLKKMLNFYKSSYNENKKLFVEDEIEKKNTGYKRTYYQFMGQFGLEYKGKEEDDIFLYQTYLQTFTDEELEAYITFWFMTYYTPNYRVKASDQPIIIYIELLKKILNSPDATLPFEQFRDEFLNHGSQDILKNLIINYGKYIKYKEGISLLIEAENIIKAKEIIKIIEEEFPIPTLYNNGLIFFNRYKEESFKKFIDLTKFNFKKKFNLKSQFEYWLTSIYKQKNGLPLVKKTIQNYIKYLNNTVPEILELKEKSIFEIIDKKIIDNFYKKFKNELISIDDITNRAYSSALKLYSEFLIFFKTNYSQEIIYGAPGTGKSYYINKLLQGKEQFIERVTFYDGYSNSQFLGSYKPISKNNSIFYEFTPGPVFRILSKAFKNQDQQYILVIEEINRACADKVFGELFQLLDRNDIGESRYPISLSEEQTNYFKKYLGDIYENTIQAKNGLYFPNNLSILCTMNSGDQNVYPLDSAFKRRWNFKYIGLDENKEYFGEKSYKYLIPIDKDKYIEWEQFRTTINNILLKNKIKEDRLLAPFFISPKDFNHLENDNYILDVEIFKSKILMYLFEDILRHNGKYSIFNEEILTFSHLIKNYLNSDIFNENFYGELNNED